MIGHGVGHRLELKHSIGVGVGVCGGTPSDIDNAVVDLGFPCDAAGWKVKGPGRVSGWRCVT